MTRIRKSIQDNEAGRDRLISYNTYVPGDSTAQEFTVYRYSGGGGKKTPTMRTTQTREGGDVHRKTWRYEEGHQNHIDSVRFKECRLYEGTVQPIVLGSFFEAYAWDTSGRRIVTTHSNDRDTGDHAWNYRACDFDGGNLLVERRDDTLLAAYAYGPFGPIARTGLMDPEGACVRWLLSDGRGTTSGSADDAGNIQIQHFDAFGVALETAVISTCPMPECATCERGRRATGELGYHGQEGYKTRHYDANRGDDLPNKATDHPEYNAAYPEGYETSATGFMQVGARDYDPTIGRWLEVDPQPTGPEMNWGQLNRWTYCANDPVNFSDPSGAYLWLQILSLIGLLAGTIGLVLGVVDMAQNGPNVGNILSIVGGIAGLLTGGASAFLALKPLLAARYFSALDAVLIDFLVFTIDMIISMLAWAATGSCHYLQQFREHWRW